MRYKKIPGTNIEISIICLGTMTWGQQNTEKQGHEQMDYAFSKGVNFFDTAELYPIPPKRQTQGETERIIGTWFKSTGNRDKVILASKIAGPANFTTHIRNDLGYHKNAIDHAIEQSLKRLQTDYIDLYQLHWPERKTNFFGLRGYSYDETSSWDCNFQEILDHLNAHIKTGNIRHIGVSNETPWGVMKFLEIGKSNNLPLIRTIQNPYSLLNRLFEVGNAEICHREKMGLLAYSPMAFGSLSGKYLKGQKPKDARLTLFPNYDRYSKGPCLTAIEQYVALAEEFGLSPAQVALSFVNSRSFLTSNIIGATTMEQLKENIDSVDLDLDEDILTRIEEIHESQPNPST